MTKAAAKRWLASNVGCQVDTVQVRPSGMTWEPGPRTLDCAGNVFTLDGSRVSLTTSHVVLDVSPERLRVEWLDDDGVRIHVTTYTVV